MTAGTTGGRVEVLGRSVTLQSGATIDASGQRRRWHGPRRWSSCERSVVESRRDRGRRAGRHHRRQRPRSGQRRHRQRLGHRRGPLRQARIAANGGNWTAASSKSAAVGFFRSLATWWRATERCTRHRAARPGPDHDRDRTYRQQHPTASVIDGDALTRMLRSGTHVNLTATESITVNHLLDGRPLDGGTTPSGNVRLTAAQS